MRLRNSVSFALGTFTWKGRIAFEFSLGTVAGPLPAIAGIATAARASDAMVLRALKFLRVATLEVNLVSVSIFIVLFRSFEFCFAEWRGGFRATLASA
jgi:hypothetical protein